MEAITFIFCIIILIVSILQIILFFKIWQMTNNVAELKDYIINKNFLNVNTNKTDKSEETKIEDGINPSRKVKRLSDGKRMLISYMMGDDVYMCIDPETKEQLGKFKKSEIEKGW